MKLIADGKGNLVLTATGQDTSKPEMIIRIKDGRWLEFHERGGKIMITSQAGQCPIDELHWDRDLVLRDFPDDWKEILKAAGI